MKKEEFPLYFTNRGLIEVALEIVFATGDALFARQIRSSRVSSEASDSILKDMLIP